MVLINTIENVRKLLLEASHKFQEEIAPTPEEIVFTRIFFDHVKLISDSDIIQRFPTECSLADKVSAATTALVFFYGHCMSRLPTDFREGMGTEAFFGVAGLPLGYLETLKDVMQSYELPSPNETFEFLELIPGLFLGSEMTPRNRDFVERFMENLGARNLNDFLSIMLEKIGIPIQVCAAFFKSSEVLMQTWFNDLVATMEEED